MLANVNQGPIDIGLWVVLELDFLVFLSWFQKVKFFSLNVVFEGEEKKGNVSVFSEN
jgi:hypothetical protein